MIEEVLSLNARKAIRHIRNEIMQHGRFPSVRELMSLLEYKSPRSAALLLEELEKKEFIGKKGGGGYQLVKDLDTENTVRTVSVPLIGEVSCGLPILAQENVEALIPVSVTLIRTGSKYFLLRAKGDSMNLAGIFPGDLILVKQQPTAENGQNVVALIDDEATVKEFQHRGEIITLVPRSSNIKHRQIIVTADLKIQGIVIATIPNIIH